MPDPKRWLPNKNQFNYKWIRNFLFAYKQGRHACLLLSTRSAKERSYRDLIQTHHCVSKVFFISSREALSMTSGELITEIQLYTSWGLWKVCIAVTQELWFLHFALFSGEIIFFVSMLGWKEEWCSYNNSVSLEEKEEKGKKGRGEQPENWMVKCGWNHRIGPNLRIRRVKERGVRGSQPCPHLSSHVSRALVTELTFMFAEHNCSAEMKCLPSLICFCFIYLKDLWLK